MRHNTMRTATSPGRGRRVLHEMDALSQVARPEALEVKVSNGEVTLRGEVDSIMDAKTLPVMVSHVPGVVSVDSELRPFRYGQKQPAAVEAHL